MNDSSFAESFLPLSSRMSASKLIAGVISNIAIFGVLLFLPAGTLNWWHGWIFLSVAAVGTVVSTVSIYRVNKAVLAERFKPPLQKGQPLVDKIIVILLITEFVGLIVFIPLDVFRFHFMRPPGPLASLLGLVLFIAGWWIITLTLRENAFAAPVHRRFTSNRSNHYARRTDSLRRRVFTKKTQGLQGIYTQSTLQADSFYLVSKPCLRYPRCFPGLRLGS